MKKIGLICATALLGMSLTACGSQSTKQASSSSKASSSKVVKHHKKANKHSEKKQESASSNSSSVASSSSQQSQSTGNGQLSQGEINRQRGYDPNGTHCYQDKIMQPDLIQMVHLMRGFKGK